MVPPQAPLRAYYFITFTLLNFNYLSVEVHYTVTPFLQHQIQDGGTLRLSLFPFLMRTTVARMGEQHKSPLICPFLHPLI